MAARKRRRKGSKRRKKKTAKGKIPLAILKRRHKTLGNIIKRRGG